MSPVFRAVVPDEERLDREMYPSEYRHHWRSPNSFEDQEYAAWAVCTHCNKIACPQYGWPDRRCCRLIRIDVATEAILFSEPVTLS